MFTTLTELTRMNYQKIGLVLEESLNLRVNGRWTAAFLQFQLFPRARKAPPPLILDSFLPKEFARWFKRYQPDVIISVNRFGLNFVKHFGLRMPQDVDYASLDLDGLLPEYPDVTGIDQNSHLEGAAAMDMLVVSMQRKQRGIPLHPMRIEVEGDWKTGESTRYQKLK